MKTTLNSLRKLTLAGIAGAFVLASGATLWAHDGDWDSTNHVYTDQNGYWDHHDHHQKYVLHKGHHGYYNEGHVFISVN